jgi:hypothetical protein
MFRIVDARRVICGLPLLFFFAFLRAAFLEHLSLPARGIENPD